MCFASLLSFQSVSSLKIFASILVVGLLYKWRGLCLFEKLIYVDRPVYVMISQLIMHDVSNTYLKSFEEHNDFNRAIDVMGICSLFLHAYHNRYVYSLGAADTQHGNIYIYTHSFTLLLAVAICADDII